MADCRLIERVWRAKRFYPASPELCSDLTSNEPKLTLFSNAERKALAACTEVSQIEQIVQKSAYRGWLDGPREKSVEYKLERRLFDECRRLIRFSTYPSVVMFCYLQLSAVETQNLLRVIEGVKFQVAPQVIAENLILES